ncbi:amidohydrolase family protein [Microbacterium pseudoresistens]|uniref:Imidazolonepropionase-like amidohydrolase n=1 Tax=Microbacterium pseudoresistens TaxID=640634 RepID=A0A7Y9JMN5_9MICO|nr:amidohydrolase family protein [Microbacterium pseudoresistens]NYD53708.1 imidazolonepropionase-like amidohydrolase [Microbacterium pseudoresistens]
MLITGAKVWGGRGRGFVERDLAIADGIVVDRAPEGAERIDGSGRWVIPGLSDAHFHAYAFSLDGFESERGPLSYAALQGSRRLEAALRRGFTTVRDVAGGDIGLKHAADRGLFPSPRYLFTGPALSQTGGHGDPRSEHVDVCFTHGHMCELVDGVDSLRVAVRDRLRTGAHAIKVMTSGGVFSLTDPLLSPQYSAEELRAVADEAHRRGSYVTAHSYSSESVRHSIENGVRCIEHGNFIDAATAEEMSRLGVFLVPTLVTYEAMGLRGASLGLNEVSLAKNAEVLSKGKEAAQLALRAGVRLGFGTDLMGDMEDEQLRGVQLQVEAIGAEEALHSMTAGNAEIFGDASLGHLDHGAHGDAIVLSDDPIENPSALWEIDAHLLVVQRGSVVA